jgi:YidC/Oxa1 family membrane protein insertase
MDRNTLLAFALSFAVLTLWMLFTTPTPGPTRPAAPAIPPREEGAQGAVADQPVEEGAAPALPEPEAATPRELQAVAESTAAPSAEVITLDTPLFRAELDPVGAALRHLELKGYRVSPAPDSPAVTLTTGKPPFANALATPFRELGMGDLSQVAFTVQRSGDWQIGFSYESGGIRVRKDYTFDPADYAFSLRVSVENGSDGSIGPRYGVSWPAHVVPGHDFAEQSFAALHDGSVILKPVASFGQAGFFDSSPETQEVLRGEVDWTGVVTTYFVCAVLPDDPADASAQLVATQPGRAGVVQLFFEPVTLPPGQKTERIFRIYAGPKESERLEAVGGGLIRSIDVGWDWLAPLTLFFGWLLRALYSVIPNYGVAIILLTILVRVVTTPLTMKQMRSMERMRALQPKLQELREKHPDDRQKQSEEMMQLYRREGVNPLGGCLPMVLQLPVFIGLFYALRSSIDLRQAPFVGWIDDLSAPDALFEIPGIGIPLRVLPLVMGATMVVQQRITPMQADPAQAKMMMTVMPVMMTVLFYQFPSGLVLYWMVSNVLAIAHQFWVGRTLRTARA